jgi:transcription-repair coupling factor (superfamily II helicase)
LRQPIPTFLHHTIATDKDVKIFYHSPLKSDSLSTNFKTQVIKKMKNWNPQIYGNLLGSSASLLISQIAQQTPLMVITPDSFTAQRLLEEVQFYAPPSLPILSFPDWETLPYDRFSPHQEIISIRLATLYHLPTITHGALILPVTTLIHRLAPQEYVKTHSLLLTIGQTLVLEKWRLQLESSGYQCVSQVVAPGEFAIRGSLVDLYPMGSLTPYRIDLFDNEIETIRSFDPETQRSQAQLSEIRLLPAREFPLTSVAIEYFLTQWRDEFGEKYLSSSIYQNIKNSLPPAGIEYYLPLFFEQTQTLFDYLPAQTTIISLPNVLEAAEQFWQEINTRYEQLRHDIQRPLLTPPKLFLSLEQIIEPIHQLTHIQLTSEKINNKSYPKNQNAINITTQAPPSLSIDTRTTQPLATLKKFLTTFTGPVLITAETTGRRESLLDLLQQNGLKPTLVDDWQNFLTSSATICLTIAPLEQGLLLLESQNAEFTFPLELPPLALITETQLFGERVAQRRLRKKTTQREIDAVIHELTELTIGAPVVHEEYGVGRYQGLVTLIIGGIEGEFLQLEYAKQDKLYVPISALHAISRFTGTDAERAPLHRLGSGQWEKAKKKATQRATDVAAELLELYAHRATRQGHAFKLTHEYQAFAQAFPFEETPDQQETIAAVIADMTAKQPMDRLVCGDVGFGKTEVAMRAAFITVLDGRQVAILVPTTLLAQQHYQTFCDRFADWAIRIEQLSRFRTAKQQTDILAAVADGKVDIIIGTHKLLQNNLKFKQLGLVIIDEEHRFGVKQKEHLKSLRAEIDILTLTATPIPRSLNLALSDLRDLSIIATPPPGRLAIETFIIQWDLPHISEAILRELKRGGQIYFLHNDIETMEKIAKQINALIPTAKTRIAHGRMRERELEQVMQDFYHRRFNILICTTIIETGIDVPTANTIIINRADKLGLAQLYQLRGRVGRSHHRAYAYLIVPEPEEMTKDAQKRIEAIASLDDLGIGFTLATHDLEIRGAGELLGSEQSGHIQEVGFSLYTELLERAIKTLKSGQPLNLERPLLPITEVNLHTPALLPNHFLPDVHARLIMYKRIANAPDLEALTEIQVETIDRFGLLPEPAKALFKCTEIKLKAKPLGIRKIDLSPHGGYFLFEEQATVNSDNLIQLIQTQPKYYKLDGKAAPKLHIQMQLPEFTERCHQVEQILADLMVNYE